MENKRKSEKTFEKYKESTFDNEDTVNNKVEYDKLFQKKFVEVEIYLKWITVDMGYTKKKKNIIQIIRWILKIENKNMKKEEINEYI